MRRNGGSMFQRPADDDSLIVQEDTSVDDSAGTSYIYNNPYLSMSIQQQRSRLPIFKHKNQLIYLLSKFRVVVVVGETGCGKSTQIPQYLVEAGFASEGQQVCVTQPRRVAAVTLSSRVADEMMCTLGGVVGYSVRFNDMMSEKTKIKYMTDGILLRELLIDPLLTNYSVIMVDEAHERSVNTDLLLSFLRKIIVVRPQLRLIISSATIDAEFFRDFFELNKTNNADENIATIISVEGRTFPVRIFYTKVGVPDYVKATVEIVLKIHKNEEVGDILAFLTGQDEVESACSMLRLEAESMRKQKLDTLFVVPLYSGLSAKEQLKAFDSSPYQTRKVVLATNIAETSVTIPGVSYVIDCGFVKMRVFDTKSDLETLMVVPCSKSSADQRAGRAGRVRPGKCFRLYPESEYNKMMLTTLPEIQRGDLASVLLRLKALGVQNIMKFNYLSRPSTASMIRALHLLYALNAIDNCGFLTQPMGFQMAEMPLAPMFAKALIMSPEYECSLEIATIIAMTQVQDVFIVTSDKRHRTEVSRRAFAVEEGDHLSLLNVFTAFLENGKQSVWCLQNHLNYKVLCRVERIRDQLLGFLKKFQLKVVSCKGTIGDTAKIRRCLLSGFFPQVARYDHTGLYVTIRGECSFKAYKGSSIMYRKDYPKWVMFTDVTQNCIRYISEIDLSWLHQVAEHYYDFGSEMRGVQHTQKDIAEGRLANIN